MKKSIYFLIAMFFPLVLTAQWQQVYSPTDVYLLNNIKFFDDQTGVLLADNGFIQITQDGGLTWNTLTYSDQTASMSDFFKFETSNYVALSVFSTLMVSHNSGTLWNQVSPDLSFPQAADFLNSNLGYCAAFGMDGSTIGSAIYRLEGIGPYQVPEQVYFTDQDGYFDHILCLDDQVTFATFEISDNNPPLPAYTGKLLRSDDGGNTWSQLLQLSTGKTFLKLGKSLDGNCLYAHTTEGMFYSTDEGLTWENQEISLVTVDLISRQTAYGVVITSGFGSMIDTLNLAYTEDAWQTWTSQLKIPFDPFYIDRSIQLQMVDENTGYYAYCNQLYKTTNGGFVGISEKPNNELYELYIVPNPVTEYFRIDLPDMLSEVTITIFDSRGTSIFSKEIDSDQQYLHIDCSLWNPGLYFVNLESMAGKQTKSKLIIR